MNRFQIQFLSPYPARQATALFESRRLKRICLMYMSWILHLQTGVKYQGRLIAGDAASKGALGLVAWARSNHLDQTRS